MSLARLSIVANSFRTGWRHLLIAIYKSLHKATRQRRYEIIRSLFIPFLIAQDTRRAFNDEERRIAWVLSADKKCAICGKTVELKDYELDHIVPHSKGGKTELKNSQITHKSCNIKKSNK